jgi:hypothetical protein
VHQPRDGRGRARAARRGGRNSKAKANVARARGLPIGLRCAWQEQGWVRVGLPSLHDRAGSPRISDLGELLVERKLTCSELAVGA